MTAKKFLLLCYLVISGGVFGWAFGVGILLIVTAVISNLLALSSTGQQILKTLQPVASFLSMAFPIACIIAGIIINVKRGNKIKQNVNELGN
jgi:hypothetical protein